MNIISTLHTVVRGTGETIVLIHGFLSSSTYWRKVTELLAQNYRVVAVDLLGFGKSPKPRKSRYGYDEHIEAINAALEREGVRGPFILMGHSMGALISLRYATLYQHRVTKLILTNMPVMMNATQVSETIVKSSLMYRLGLTVAIHRLTWGMFKALYRVRLLPRKLLRELHEEKSYMFAHSPASRMRSFHHIIRDARVDVDLRLVRAKTVILAGIDDHKIYLDNLIHHIRLGSNIILKTYHTGHHIPRFMPEVLIEALKLHNPKGV